MKIVAIISLLFLLALKPAFSQKDTVVLSLEQAVAFAIENSITARNANLDYEINRKRALEIITEGLPRLSLDITYKHNLKLPTTVIPSGSFAKEPIVLPPMDTTVVFGTAHNVNADFLVTQLIADGRYFIGLKANKTIKAIGEQQVVLAESDVRNQVQKSYYAVLVADESTELVDRNIVTLEQLLYETTELYKSGFAEELDVDRLQLQLTNMISNQKRTALQLELTKNVLKYQMGLDHNTPIVLSDSLETLLSASATEVSANFDHTLRTEYRLLNLNYAMRGFDAQRIRAAYLPSLSAFASYGFNAQRQEFNIFDFDRKWFQVGYWGLELDIPIFDSYKNGSLYKQKKYEQLKLKNQIEDFEQQSKLQVTQTTTEYRNALEEYQNQQMNLQLAQKIYDKVTIMYKEGLASSFELADAETSLNLSQSNYLNALYDVLLKRTDLEKALGLY